MNTTENQHFHLRCIHSTVLIMHLLGSTLVTHNPLPSHHRPWNRWDQALRFGIRRRPGGLDRGTVSIFQLFLLDGECGELHIDARSPYHQVEAVPRSGRLLLRCLSPPGLSYGSRRFHFYYWKASIPSMSHIISKLPIGFVEGRVSGSQRKDWEWRGCPQALAGLCQSKVRVRATGRI